MRRFERRRHSGNTSPARVCLGLLAACLSLVVASPARAEHTIRVATLAPKVSAWGKTFARWQRAVEKRTNGELQVKVYYNGVMGDDAAMVSKMKSGQIDAAALSSVGLSHVYKDVMVLQLPGVVDSWSTLDKVRKGMRSEIEAGFEAKGFYVLGWGDLGRTRQMTKGFAVRTPADMRGKSPAIWRNEPMGPVIFAEIPGVTPVPLSVPELLPALRSGKVNVITAPPLAAEALQWTAQFDHIGGDSSVCAIGGSLVKKDALDSLPADVKSTLLKLQKKYAKKSAKRIRKLDDEAYARAKRKMTVVQLSDAEKAEWEKVLRAAIEKLAQGTFPRPLVEKVVQLSGKK